MDAQQQAAFVMAQSAAALIEALGMVADNQQRISLGHSIAYDGAAFQSLIGQYSLGHNDVIGLFRS